MALEPTYLGLDFDTIKKEIIDNLSETDTFKDYDFEGSNISVLIELISYLGDLNTYYLNKLSKNLYLDTVEIYENIHRLAELTGYTPYGYQASSTDLTIEISQNDVGDYFNVNDILYVPRFKNMSAELENQQVRFITTQNNYEEVDLSGTDNGRTSELTYFRMDVPIKQGNQITYNYTGADIYNYKIFLPFLQFDNEKIVNKENSVGLEVNGENGQRVNTFFEGMSGLDQTNKLFRFGYDKYRRYYIEFSPSLTVPNRIDEIEINLIETFGEEGNVGRNLIRTKENEQIVYNITKGLGIPNELVNITNLRQSSGGKEPETINEIRRNIKNFLNTQYRCITTKDYKNYLERYPDILKGAAGGQQELKYSSDVRDYNKVYLTLIPEIGGLSSIDVKTETGNLGNGKSIDVMIPNQFLQSFKNDVERYLAPYKSLNSYHSYILPELVYFAFDISLSVKKNYDFSVVLNDLKNKLDFLFSNEERNFGDIIDYKETEEQLRDSTISSSIDSFSNTKGIKYIRIRDIHCNYTIYEPNVEQKFPQYQIQSFDTYVENKLRNIQLGPGQFPILDSSSCLFITEG